MCSCFQGTLGSGIMFGPCWPPFSSARVKQSTLNIVTSFESKEQIYMQAVALLEKIQIKITVVL